MIFNVTKNKTNKHGSFTCTCTWTMTVSISFLANCVQAERTDRQGNQASLLAFSPVSPRLAIVSFACASILGYCQQSKGLFTWARLPGLARFPRSRLNSKSFVKFLMCSCERAGWLLQKHDLCFPSYHTGSIISLTSAENNWANRCVCYSIQPTIKSLWQWLRKNSWSQRSGTYLCLSLLQLPLVEVSVAFDKHLIKETWLKVETVNSMHFL